MSQTIALWLALFKLSLGLLNTCLFLVYFTWLFRYSFNITLYCQNFYIVKKFKCTFKFAYINLNSCTLSPIISLKFLPCLGPVSLVCWQDNLFIDNNAANSFYIPNSLKMFKCLLYWNRDLIIYLCIKFEHFIFFKFPEKSSI